MKEFLDHIGSGGRKALILLFAVLSLGMVSSIARAVDPDDNGGWSSPQTAQQGWLVQYAPLADPALVFFWFTHDENGEQAWFISDNIPIGASNTEDVANIYKPICVFADSPENPVTGKSACDRGDAVGVIAVSNRGQDLMIRFAIRDIEGFGADCAAGLSLPVLPSPVPPAFPADEYPCQGTLVTERVWPGIPALAD